MLTTFLPAAEEYALKYSFCEENGRFYSNGDKYEQNTQQSKQMKSARFEWSVCFEI